MPSLKGGSVKGIQGTLGSDGDSDSSVNSDVNRLCDSHRLIGQLNAAGGAGISDLLITQQGTVQYIRF